MTSHGYRRRGESLVIALIRSLRSLFPRERWSSRNIFVGTDKITDDEREVADLTDLDKKFEHDFRSRTSVSEQICDTEDADFWRLSTAPVLHALMRHAEYNDQRIGNAMKFYDEYVIGSLGPHPAKSIQTTRWKSFMTDDFTPIEFSWNWGPVTKQAESTIRFSIEPISLNAGSASDLWNLQASLSLLTRLDQTLPNIDISVFKYLEQAMGKMTEKCPSEAASVEAASPSSMFLAFELEGQHPMVKAYMLPFRRTTASQISCTETTIDFLRPFALDKEWKSLSDLLGFLSSNGGKLGIEPFMIAFDCVPFLQTRMKIYVRSHDTSFRGVRKILSLFQNPNNIEKALVHLEKLWSLVFCSEVDFDWDAPLRDEKHETAGILYYLEVRPGSTHVTTKVYLPLKHYASNDQTAAHGLVDFVEQMRGATDGVARSYLSALKEICTHRKLEDGTGLQTYLSCAIKNGDLDITSYLNPEVYHPGRSRTEI